MEKKYLNLLLLSLVSLQGCEGGTFLTTRGIIAEGWAEPPEPYEPEPVYCYKTLAGKDCFRKPLKGQENRLVGSYGEKKVVEAERPPSEDETMITESKLAPEETPLSLKKKKAS